MGSLSITNATVFDGFSRELLDGPVHIVDGRIAMVGDAPETADRILDARGGTVIPGLIDAHFHAYGVSLDGLFNNAVPLSYAALAGARRLAAALRRGFTTVRDPGGGDAGIARAIKEGLLASPRYLWMGAALSQTGGHGDVREPDTDVCACWRHSCEVVDGVDPLRRAVRERFRHGAHAVKIMASGGVMSLSDPIRVPQYSADEIRAVTDEARRRGSYVAAHAYSPESIVHAVSNGVRSVEHGNLLDAPTARIMADADAYLVPTLAAYFANEGRADEVGLRDVSRRKNKEVLDSGCAALETAVRAGVRVGFGTDLMGPLEDEQLNGLRLHVEVAGVLAALRSATSVNAALLGRADLGRIREGAIADLVVLDANPLEDPSVLWARPGHRTVIQDGHVLSALCPCAMLTCGSPPPGVLDQR